MRWFLRMFPAFVEMESERNHWRDAARRTEGQLEEAHGRIDDLKKSYDVLSHRVFGRNAYQRAEAPAAESVQRPPVLEVPRMKVFAGELRQRQYNKFTRDMQQFLSDAEKIAAGESNSAD